MTQLYQSLIEFQGVDRSIQYFNLLKNKRYAFMENIFVGSIIF